MQRFKTAFVSKSTGGGNFGRELYGRLELGDICSKTIQY
jgi:hypothetical protein